jgi:hypothetical protein
LLTAFLPAHQPREGWYLGNFASWTPLAQKQANEIEAFLENTTEGGA